MGKSQLPEQEITRTAIEIRQYVRSLDGMNYGIFAKQIGISRFTMSTLVNMRKSHGDIITPAINNALLSAGLDLSKRIPSLIVIQRRGKTCNFHPNFGGKLKTKDPINLLNQARGLVIEATDIIRKKITTWEEEIEEREDQIEKLKKFKEELTKLKGEAIDSIVSSLAEPTSK